MEFAFPIASFLIGAIVVACILIVKANNRKYENFVLLHSSAIKKVNSLNKEFTFAKIPSCNLEHSYDNENFYDDISPQDYLTYQLVYSQKEVKNHIRATKENRRLYAIYENQLKRDLVFGSFDTEITLKNPDKLRNTELNFFKEAKLTPTTDFSIMVDLWRTDIKGRAYERKTDVFNESEIEEIISRLNQKSNGFYLNEDIWQSICRVERGKVSNKMRFAIYQRDGYRCKKCGRATDDLEVDHIYPIAKGGKSTFDNLQTLCHRCNALKSDTVEFGAVNPRAKNQSVNHICPQCGATLVFKKGKYGNFYGCPNYPNCKFTKKA